MRIKHLIRLRIARDTEMRRALFSDDEQLAEKVIDGYQRHAQGHISIAIGATESLSLGDVTSVKGIYLELDGAADVKFNGSADALTLAPTTAETESTAKMLMEAEINAVSIENTSGALLSGVYVMWGDPTV